MIFVTVGTSRYFPGFPRLVAWMDDWAATHDEPVVIQHGAAPTTLRHATGTDFLDQNEWDSRVAQARVVVGHVGAGTLLACRAAGRPLIAVPRDPGQGEVLDGHQEELADRLASAPWVSVARNPAELAAALAGPLESPLPGESAPLIAALRSELHRLLGAP